jgi:hypothetical protein
VGYIRRLLRAYRIGCAVSAVGELYALAERCEQAMAADYALDAAIWCVLNDMPVSKRIIYDFERGEAQRYTASLDAAMTLVPEGWVIGSVAEEAPRTQWVVELRRGYRTSYDKAIFSDCRPGQRCKTFALALCAAALRARAASPTQGRP